MIANSFLTNFKNMVNCYNSETDTFHFTKIMTKVAQKLFKFSILSNNFTQDASLLKYNRFVTIHF